MSDSNDTIITELSYPQQWIGAIKGSLLEAIFLIIVVTLGNEFYFHIEWLEFYKIVIISLTVAIFRYKSREFILKYKVDKDDFYINQLLFHKGRTIPYGAVKDVTVHQDFLDKFFGLASVHISYAGKGKLFHYIRPVIDYRQKTYEDSDITIHNIIIPYLKKHDAELLKNAILMKLK